MHDIDILNIYIPGLIFIKIDEDELSSFLSHLVTKKLIEKHRALVSSRSIFSLFTANNDAHLKIQQEILDELHKHDQYSKLQSAINKLYLKEFYCYLPKHIVDLLSGDGRINRLSARWFQNKTKSSIINTPHKLFAISHNYHTEQLHKEQQDLKAESFTTIEHILEQKQLNLKQLYTDYLESKLCSELSWYSQLKDKQGFFTLDSCNFSILKDDLISVDILAQRFTALFNELSIKYQLEKLTQDHNQVYASRIATLVFNSIIENERIKLTDWREQFKSDLISDFTISIAEQYNQLLKHDLKKTSLNLRHSLAYLFEHSSIQEKKQFFDKMADAHGFIQAIGFSTQNENSVLAILDFYNYTRYAGDILEHKKIFFSLLQPFKSIYDEYKNIALYEKNVFSKIFRTVMPLIIIAAFMVLIGSLLAPWILPELVFFIVAIPALYLGIVLAAQYITVKNDVFYFFRTLYYGGAYKIPEFQANERMLKIFGDKELVDEIKEFYIKELKQCDAKEQFYKKNLSFGLLSHEEIKDRKNNLQRRHTLCMEWYDIHSNTELGFDKVKQLIAPRIYEMAHNEYSNLETSLINYLNQFCLELFKELEEIFRVNPSLDSTIEASHLDKKLIDPSNSLTEIKAQYSFFALTQTSKLDRLSTAVESNVKPALIF